MLVFGLGLAAGFVIAQLSTSVALVVVDRQRRAALAIRAARRNFPSGNL
jgi:hypothetical protein